MVADRSYVLRADDAAAARRPVGLCHTVGMERSVAARGAEGRSCSALWEYVRMRGPAVPYYRHDLALVHDRGFAFHAAACARGIVDLLAAVRARDGLVLELGCGRAYSPRN